MPDPQVPKSEQDAAILTLRRWMCCDAGHGQVWRELIVPFAHSLVDDAMVERAASAYQFGVFPGDESEATDDEIREMARAVLVAAFSTQKKPEAGTQVESLWRLPRHEVRPEIMSDPERDDEPDA